MRCRQVERSYEGAGYKGMQRTRNQQVSYRQSSVRVTDAGRYALELNGFAQKVFLPVRVSGRPRIAQHLSAGIAGGKEISP